MGTPLEWGHSRSPAAITCPHPGMLTPSHTPLYPPNRPTQPRPPLPQRPDASGLRAAGRGALRGGGAAIHPGGWPGFAVYALGLKAGGRVEVEVWNLGFRAGGLGADTTPHPSMRRTSWSGASCGGCWSLGRGWRSCFRWGMCTCECVCVCMCTCMCVYMCAGRWVRHMCACVQSFDKPTLHPPVLNADPLPALWTP